MSKALLICSVIGCAFAFIPIAPAHALTPDVASGLSTASAGLDSTVQVKRSALKRTPPGWSRGRKVGWRGGHKPPGQRR